MKLHTHYASGFTILQFNNEDKEIGRLWNDNGKLAFDGNATDAAHQLFKYLIREYDEFLKASEARAELLHKELLTMEHDRDHWKANHDHQVESARVLKNRKDMPVDRSLLHEALLALPPQVLAGNNTAKNVVTSLPTLDLLLDVFEAARKLVQCKGRYHAELNYKALAALFGVETPYPQAEAPSAEQCAAMDELTALTQQMEENRITLSPEAFDKVQQLIDEPPAPNEALVELMTREPRYIRRDTKND
ncbi:DUF1778 domain-containing protein [Salmonella enterica]|nr:DUF1778 domain-containing protein [Salmonella enterica]